MEKQWAENADDLTIELPSAVTSVPQPTATDATEEAEDAGAGAGAGAGAVVGAHEVVVVNKPATIPVRRRPRPRGGTAASS